MSLHTPVFHSVSPVILRLYSFSAHGRGRPRATILSQKAFLVFMTFRRVRRRPDLLPTLFLKFANL